MKTGREQRSMSVYVYPLILLWIAAGTSQHYLHNLIGAKGEASSQPPYYLDLESPVDISNAVVVLCTGAR